MTREDFVGVTRNAMAGLGFDQDVSMVVFPIDPFLVDSDISPIGEALQDFADGLTTWKPAANEIGVKSPPLVAIEANGYEAAVDKMNRQFLINTWGDGLPLNPPSAERVDWILSGTDMARDEIVGKFMPRGGVATVETIAVSLAMAGGRPEYLPVLIAAVDGFLDPGLEHDKVQATSGSTYPVIIVNVPIADEIRLNSGFGLLGPDPQHPAGASIGRALRLLQQNVGGALPGVGTMSIFGGMRYTNAVFAEDEAGLPDDWDTVARTQFGFENGENAVTVVVATGASNIVRRGVGKETAAVEAEQGLRRVASYLGSSNPHYTWGHAEGTPGVLLMPRVVARQMNNLGWDKARIKKFLWENSKIPWAEVEESGLKQWIEAAPHPDTVASSGEDPWAICRKPEQLILTVAGGEHPTHNFWMQAASAQIAGRKIGLPENWDALINTADDELGPRGEMCVI